ncbi:hypothetical protein DM02DRAFT_569316, partial [Periconia macrospinosa]
MASPHKRSAEESISRTPKKSRRSFDVDSFFKVVVGRKPDQKTFLVHEEIICERSEFFRRAMNGNWAESTDRIVKLPEDRVEIFETYLNLIYTGKIPTELHAVPPTLDQMLSEYECLFRLYILAEKLQDIDAKNAAIESVL